MRTSIHVWHLELTTSVRPAPLTGASYKLQRVPSPTPEFSRYLYLGVGASCMWYMRLNWSWQQWQARFSDPRVELWVATDGAVPIGYFELEAQSQNTAEICYFGLFPEALGKGQGARLLEDAITCGFQLGKNRVWLHTCSLDHPAALPNYLKRGFKLFREEDVVDNLPDEPIQPWPGANKPV